MRQLQNFGLILLFALGVTFSCKDSGNSRTEEESSPRIVKTTKLISPKGNTTFKIGESINFKVDGGESAIDSVLLDYEKTKIMFKSTTFEWLSEKVKTGSQKIRLTVYFGGSNETHYPKITFLSDVVPEEYTYEVVKSYPHDVNAFTQGLFFKDDTLIESTGQRGESRLSKLNLENGQIFKTVNLDDKYFGEGSCHWNNQYFQLTWTGKTGFVYDNKLNQLKTFNYTHEGWGITVWGDTLYVSDGSNVIHRIDPRDFSEIGKLEVYDQEEKITNLNELEIINGLLYANIYQEDFVAVIDPISGKLLKMIDLAGLLTPLEARRTDVLNGIAYHPTWDKLFVTGKLWPTIFEIKLIPKN
ncbi:MAG: glutamine cyclotransferase [Cyclobacteriaceae bacterium]|jgi:glutamine cyclotransferase